MSANPFSLDSDDHRHPGVDQDQRPDQELDAPDDRLAETVAAAVLASFQDAAPAEASASASPSVDRAWADRASVYQPAGVQAADVDRLSAYRPWGFQHAVFPAAELTVSHAACHLAFPAAGHVDQPAEFRAAHDPTAAGRRDHPAPAGHPDLAHCHGRGEHHGRVHYLGREERLALELHRGLSGQVAELFDRRSAASTNGCDPGRGRRQFARLLRLRLSHVAGDTYRGHETFGPHRGGGRRPNRETSMCCQPTGCNLECR